MQLMRPGNLKLEEIIRELADLQHGINVMLSPPTQQAGSKLESFGHEVWGRLGRCIEDLRKVDA